LSQELAYDPHVRQSVRHVYFATVVVNTHPTDKGRQDIDAFHPYREVLRIEKKPFAEFHGSVQFLLMTKAEKEGFITVSLEIPQEIHETVRNFYPFSFESFLLQRKS
jgi:transcription elongation factor SPT6